MLRVIFTLDYEIHGNGDGDPYALMVEPTRRMMALFEEYGAKLTIMADIAEILKFKEYKERFGRDDYHYEAIADQLKEAIHRGHDVQLHIHSSYFNAHHEGGRWVQDWSEYNFAGLPLQRLSEMVRRGKEFLENLLRPVDPSYCCFVFRAANWSVSPSRNVVRALVDNGIRIDTSVFKYGRRQGIVNFDYSDAPSNLTPWRVDENDVCRRDIAGKLLEVPIYSEHRWIGAFLTVNRLYRAKMTRAHRVQATAPGAAPSANSRFAKLSALVKRHAWKADFNQCSGPQLIRALNRANTQHGMNGRELPFVLIGHSKQFAPSNERSLRPYLSHVSNGSPRFGFGRFADCDFPAPAQQEAVAACVH